MVVGIVLTDACNLRCQYCCVSRKTGRRHDWRVLEDCLASLLERDSTKLDVTFTGGEPLLDFATLQRTVSYVEQRAESSELRWRVMTNGLLLEKETLSFLDAHRFRISLSCDGVPAAQALRGKGTFGRIDSLLDLLRDHFSELFEARLKVCVTLSPATMSFLADSLRYFIGKDVKAIQLTPVSGFGSWDVARISDLADQFDAVLAMLLEHYTRSGEVPLLLFRKSVGEHRIGRQLQCAAMNGKTLALDVDGNAYACLLGTHTYAATAGAVSRPVVDALRVGALGADLGQRMTATTTALNATGAFNHPERRFSSYRRCADCEFLGRCRICPLASASVPGWDDMYRVSDFLCAFNQVALAARDRFPAQPTVDDYFRGLVPLSALRLGEIPARTTEP